MVHRLLAAALVLATPGLAHGQDAFVLNYGFAFTSNYMSSGVTNSDNNPAVQAYVEGSYGIFYGGIWSSTVDFDTADQFEFDLYAGVRPTLGPVDLDVSYVRYLYDDTGDCCGEFAIDVGYPVEDLGLIGANYSYDPEFETDWGEVRAEYYFAEVWTAGFHVGTDFGSQDYGEDNMVAWDFGGGRSLGDFAWVDLRLYDSNYTSSQLVVSIGADF